MFKIGKNMYGLYIMLIIPMLFEMIPSLTANIIDRPLEDSGVFVDNQRYDMDRDNYIAQSEENQNIFDNNFDVNFPVMQYRYNNKINYLPDFEQDYINSIKNNAILYDMSDKLKKMARKRGYVSRNTCILSNIAPCKCDNSTTKITILKDHFPTYIEHVVCIPELCRYPYTCQETVYKQKILKLKTHSREMSNVELPYGLERNWVAEEIPVTIGCVCKKDYKGE